MDTIHIVLILIAVLAAIIIIGNISSVLYRKKMRAKLLASFGKVNNAEYTYEEFENISHFFRNMSYSDFEIDDITWNDLDMDRVFLLINNTNSSIGRDYLYKILREPVSDKSILDEREHLINFFENNPKERTEIMLLFNEIGFSKKISIADYMNNIFSLKPQSNLFHYSIIILMIASLCYTLFIDPVGGIGLVIVAFGAAIISYYRIKSRIDSFFECIRKLVTMIDASKKISAMNISDLSEYNEKLASYAKHFGKVSRGSFLLASRDKTSGSIGDIILEYLKMFTHLDLIKFNSMIRHIGKSKTIVIDMMNCLGLLESMISVASFRHLLPYMCEPEFDNAAGIEAKDVYHLLLSEPVANSISESRPVLITGSNASGKSTFLKSTAICALLAQTINTCPCRSYKAPFFRIYSSMALADNLEEGESYYIVEIKSLKRIVDASKKSGAKILCFVDEVLRGTNTVERIAASSQILKNLADNGVMCFAATHDIELTHILEKYYANYHFTEEVRNKQIVFSYVIQNGRAVSRNAIKLLEIMGYDNAIISSAKDRADDFIKKGIWREC